MDAKLSIVEYDPAAHDLSTVSLHQFEDAEVRDGRMTMLKKPVVKVDPKRRCAVMLLYVRVVKSLQPLPTLAWRGLQEGSGGVAPCSRGGPQSFGIHVLLPTSLQVLNCAPY